ncbi:MAG: hypothetical protein Q3999_01695 [Buchananella hordeovulneris]|nr:hypothetical protein [Buchananella hordeovulneris]
MGEKAQRLAAARQALELAEAKAGLKVLRPDFGGARGERAPVARQGGSERAVGEQSPEAVPGDEREAPVAPVGGQKLAAMAPIAGRGAAGQVTALVAAQAGQRASGPAGPDGWEFLVPAGAEQVLAVLGSAFLFLHALARLQRPDRWCAVVGHPALGWCAAQEAGVNLDNVLVVPYAGEGALRTLTALAEGVEVLAVGPLVQLSGREQRFLAGKVRSRGGVLLAARPWEGAWVLEATSEQRRFLGRGEGFVDGGSWQVSALKRPELGAARFECGTGGAAWSGGESNENARVGLCLGT